MVDPIYHMTKITLKSHFCRKNVILLSLCTQRCYGRYNVSPTSVNLSILLHGLISLPDATSYDKATYGFQREVLTPFPPTLWIYQIVCPLKL